MKKMLFLLISLTVLTANGFAESKEVHVIGTYSAKPPESAKYKSEVKKFLNHFDRHCSTRRDYRNNKCDWGGGWDKINRKFPGQITVHVSRTGKPLTLLLTAYERTVWNIKADPGVVIENIITSGYYHQKVRLPKAFRTVPVTDLLKKGNLLSVNPLPFYFFADDREDVYGFTTGDASHPCEAIDEETFRFMNANRSSFQETLDALGFLGVEPTSIQSAREQETNSFRISSDSAGNKVPKLRSAGYCYKQPDGSLKAIEQEEYFH